MRFLPLFVLALAMATPACGYADPVEQLGTHADAIVDLLEDKRTQIAEAGRVAERYLHEHGTEMAAMHMAGRELEARLGVEERRGLKRDILRRTSSARSRAAALRLDHPAVFRDPRVRRTLEALVGRRRDRAGHAEGSGIP